jgi:alpha-beta hydrolase superfamily lysophospholipase
MKTEFVRFFTDDNIELQGLYFAPSSTRPQAGVVHVHGLAGSFYEHRFVDYMADMLTDKGYAFLTFNNRGHDYLCDLRKREGSDWTYLDGGGAYETLGECRYDIDAALQLMRDKGVLHVCLLGHSSGANKVVFYQSQRKNERLSGMILLSPNDDVGLQRNAVGDDFDDVLETALTMVEEGNGDGLMPEGSFFSYPVSAKTYVDYFGPDGERDTFPYRHPQAEFEELSAIECPILVLFGNVNEYVLGDLGETLSLLARKAAASPRVDTGIIDGAPHSYLGREEELCSVIAGWLDDVLPTQ